MFARRLLGARKASWSWDFTRGAPPNGATFSRASSATYFDTAGVLRSAASNVPRFDHDPLIGEPLGFLCEMQSTNAVPNSTALGGYSATSLTVADDAVTSPDGTVNASTLVAPAENSSHLAQSGGFNITSGQTYGLSYFCKNVSGSYWVAVTLGGSFGFWFQPSTGTIGQTTNATTVAQATARQLANGWWRVSFLYTASFTGSTTLRVTLSDANAASSGPAFVGDASSAIAVWGLQHETPGVGVTSYIPTNGAAATRAADNLTMPLASLPGWDPTKGGAIIGTYRLHTVYPTSPGYYQPIASMDDGTVNNLIMSVAEDEGFGRMAALMRSAGGTQFAVSTGASAAPFVRRTQAFGWSIPRGVVAADGALVTSSNPISALPVAPSTLRFGSYVAAHYLGGTLESVAYYPGAHSDAFITQVAR